MLSQLEVAAHTWTNDVKIRLQCLAYPSRPFWIDPLVGQAIMKLLEQMASRRQRLQLDLSACVDTPIFQHVLKRARMLQVLVHLVIADRSATSPLWTNTLLFEIFANSSLETLELNFPESTATTARRRDDGAFYRLGNAIAANPSLRRLTLYTYEDVFGSGTALLLEALAKSTRPKAIQRRGIESLHLYCPKSAICRIVQDGLVPLLRRAQCRLLELEITCIRHHSPVQQEETPSNETETTPLFSPFLFPLASLTQDGLLHNVSLSRLGVFHAELTTSQVDQELLRHIHQLPKLEVVDLFGNQIESFCFPTFNQQSYSSNLQQLLLGHNPCLTQHPYDFQQFPSLFRSGSEKRYSTLSLVDMLCMLFQRHPRLYKFGIDPHKYFFYHKLAWVHEEKNQEFLLYLADVNQIGLKNGPAPSWREKWPPGNSVNFPLRTRSIIQLPSNIPSNLWPSVIQRITHHPTLIMYPSSRGALVQAQRKASSSWVEAKGAEKPQPLPNQRLISKEMATSPTSTMLWTTVPPPMTMLSPSTLSSCATSVKATPIRNADVDAGLFYSLSSFPSECWARSARRFVSASHQLNRQRRKAYSDDGTTFNKGSNMSSHIKTKKVWKKQSPQEQQQRQQRQANLILEMLRQHPTIWTHCSSTKRSTVK